LGLSFLSVELAMPAGRRGYYGKGYWHFITFSCYRRLPLLKTVRARDIFVKELGKVREEMRFHLVGCGDAGACAFVDERAAAGNAVDGAAEVEAACGAETAQAPKAGVRGADAIASCGDGRATASVLAGAVLRFQCIQQRKEEGEVELHACQSRDSRTGETS
jgi:hypothetical protein